MKYKKRKYKKNKGKIIAKKCNQVKRAENPSDDMGKQ